MLEKTFLPQDVEAKFIERWEESGLTKAEPSSDKPPFCVMMPPPNVTGSLHIGHALNHTLQDVVCRYKRMKGFDVLWQPGTDHASIAVHMVLEQQLAEGGLTRYDLGREKFLERAWEWKESSANTITTQLRRLGTTPDWTRERFTLDDGLSDAVKKAFVHMYDDGVIYRAKRLVNWDPERKTVISDLEVIQKDARSKMWHIDYPVEGEEARTIRVATTRPETMFGDTAVAVHPDDERYTDLIGKFAVLPIAGRPIPIVADEYSDPEKGSGAVKITPAHDFNDFEVGQRHDLPLINVMDESAALNENVPEAYQGLDRFAARKKILAELEELDLLADVEEVDNSLPYGERSGVIIEPYLTDQWYVDAARLAGPALEAVKDGRTKFYPKNWEKTYFNWLENIQPWCISRQLWWGHRIPAWYTEDGKVYVAESEAEALEKASKDYDGATDIILTQDEDVLDTWFSSGLWSHSTLGWPENTPELQKYYKTDVLVTAFDIIFFWVARMMMMSMYFMDDVPFEDIYMHALVRDGKGQKMSKSKGNIIDPLDLIEAYGADSMRFTLMALAAQGRDIKLSDDRVEGYRNFGTKLWNAARYCEMNDCLGSETHDVSSLESVINKWIVHELKVTAKRIDDAMDGYKYNEAATALYQFIWGTFCDWYLEFTKPILISESPLAQETRDTTGWVLRQILKLLNPFMPFMTEELNEKLFGNEELLLGTAWPEFDDACENYDAESEMAWVQTLISEIRSVRSDMNVPAGAWLTMLVKDGSAKTQERLVAHDEIIRKGARLEKVELCTGDIPKGSIQAVLDEATLILPIADIIDLDKERGRLEKEIEKLTKDVQRIDGKLGNEKFLSNAPEEVVAEQRSRKEEAELAISKLQGALEQLKAA